MANMVIFGFTVTGHTGSDDLDMTCQARCAGMGIDDPNINASFTVSPDDSASSIQAAIKAAAIQAAFDQYNITVGLLDKKTVIGGGALGL